MKLTAFLIASLLLTVSPPAPANDVTHPQIGAGTGTVESQPAQKTNGSCVTMTGEQMMKWVEALECDRSCAVTVGKARAALERLKMEFAHLDLKFNEDSVSAFAKARGLTLIVGPYYGWTGCDKKCGVLVRLSKLEGRWVFEGAALKGREPEPGAHHVLRWYVTDGEDLPSTVTRNIVDANNGDPLDWNSYPAGDLSTGLCYMESIIGVKKSQAGGQPEFIAPKKGTACGELLAR